MSWLKLDDHLDEHPKLTRCDGDYDAALSTLVQMGLYCARNLTDGLVPSRVVSRFDRRIVDILREPFNGGAGFLEDVSGGLFLHDYLDYNPSREKVLRDREQERQRKEAYRLSQRDTHRDSPTDGCPEVIDPVPVPGALDLNPKPQRSKDKPLSRENDLKGIHPSALGKWEEKQRREATPAELSSLRTLCKKHDSQTVCEAIAQAYVQINEGSSKVDNVWGLITSIAGAS
jgi:hypothetical protein